MKNLRLVPLILIPLGVAAAFSANQITQRTTLMPKPLEVLKNVSNILLTVQNLKLKTIDCKVMYGRDVSGSTLCFASPVGFDALPNLLRRSLDKIAVTNGWRDDYGTPGAFYTLKDNPEQVIGIIVNEIITFEDPKTIKNFKSYNSFIALSVNLHPREY